jgi:hypothetical protein
MEMKPNPQCSNPACVQRQVLSSPMCPPYVYIVDIVKDRECYPSFDHFVERIYAVKTC